MGCHCGAQVDLESLGSSDRPASASLVAVTTGTAVTLTLSSIFEPLFSPNKNICVGAGEMAEWAAARVKASPVHATDCSLQPN